MYQGVFKTMNGGGHTTPERPHLTLIQGGLSDQGIDAQSKYQEPSALNSKEIGVPGKILTRVKMSRMDTTIFVHPSHPDHPSNRPHQEQDESKWIPFRLLHRKK